MPTINWQAVAGTAVIVISGASDMLLQSQDPALSGWSKLAVQIFGFAATVVALQIDPNLLPMRRVMTFRRPTAEPQAYPPPPPSVSGK